METHARSITKALTWRLWAFLVTTTIVWLITRKLEWAATIGLADTAVKLVTFYLHERLWLKIRFGLRPAGDYEI